MLGFAESRVPPRGLPSESRLGGLPSFFESCLLRPRCSTCCRPLYLLVQIYAPTDRDRSLLIWACNAVSCTSFFSKGPGGSWVVQRTQSTHAYDIAETSPDVPPPAPDVPPDPWGASVAWGEDATPAAVVSQTGPAAHDPAPVPPSSASSTAPQFEYIDTSIDKFRFPACRMSSEPDAEDDGEYWPQPRGAGGGEDDDDSDEDDRDASDKSSAELVAARRWREYELWSAAAGDSSDAPGFEGGPPAPAAPGLSPPPAPALAREGGEPAATVDEEDEGSGDDSGADAAVAAVSRPPRASNQRKNRAGASSSERGGSRRGAKDVQAVDQYEATPAAVRYMLRFQAWLQRAGQPCVRYAYGLTPRWPAPPSAVLKSRVPRCACGREREFELQLLPHLLSVLDVDNHTDAAPTGASGGGRAAATVTAAPSASSPAPPVSAPPVSWGGGLDFLSVLVFSCPVSCSESDTEVAIVVPNE
jgi:hypothetical protein